MNMFFQVVFYHLLLHFWNQSIHQSCNIYNIIIPIFYYHLFISNNFTGHEIIYR